MKFESWFEEQLYPIIRRVAVKYGLEFHYQFSLKESVTSSGLRDWVEEALGLRQLRKDIKGAEANHFSLSNYGKKDDWVVAK